MLGNEGVYGRFVALFGGLTQRLAKIGRDSQRRGEREADKSSARVRRLASVNNNAVSYFAEGSMNKMVKPDSQNTSPNGHGR